MQTSPLLELKEVSKSFPGVRALDGVSIDVDRGEVVALMGENGAGKSTLLKILSGVYRPDSGTISIDGAQQRFTKPADAIASGVAYVPQETTVQPYMTVAENILLGRQPKNRVGLIDKRSVERIASRLLKSLGVEISPTAIAGALSVAQKQLILIARAIAIRAKIIIFDEATSSLTASETEHLFSVIRDLRGQGLGILFVTHRMDEIRPICDRVTVLRDGRLVATRSITDVSLDDVITMMVGRQLIDNHSRQSTDALGPEVLAVRNLSVRGMLHDINLTLRVGELVGIGGLVGSGRSELARTLFGDITPSAGTISISGEAAVRKSPKRAIRSGVALVPEDRKQEGLLLKQSIRQNISLPSLRSITRFGFLKSSLERRRVADYIKFLGVHTPSIESDVDDLSGGNQQRVVIAKWLATSPKILIVDEPTRGIDVAAKRQVHGILRDLAAQGIAVLMISSEMDELISACSRVLVMYRGTISGELAGNEITQTNIMRLALGHSRPQDNSSVTI